MPRHGDVLLTVWKVDCERHYLRRRALRGGAAPATTATRRRWGAAA
jgi:hypothetical protein